MRAIFLFCLTLALMGSAQAQSCLPAPAPPAGPPMLHLTETATEKVLPTLLVADLVATAESRNAVTAQRQLNSQMAQANSLAGKVHGVTTVFEDYQANYSDRSDGTPAHWTASQTIELRGRSGEDVLGLVGQLQAIGLTIQNLDWEVPPDQATAAALKARLQALAMLRKEAAQAAAVLGMQVESYQSVDLTGDSSPGPQMQMAAAMAPPQATADSQDISATVAGDVVLAPAVTADRKDQK